MEENGKNLLRAPIFDGPSIATCEISSQPSPSSTFGPIMQEGGIFALGSRMAVGWTFIGAQTKVFTVENAENAEESSSKLKTPRIVDISATLRSRWLKKSLQLFWVRTRCIRWT